MTWTRTPPTHHGWYFYRETTGTEFLLHVNNESCVMFATVPTPWDTHPPRTPAAVETLKGEWAGPVVEPKAQP